MFYFCDGINLYIPRISVPLRDTVCDNGTCSYQFLVNFISNFIHNSQRTLVAIRLCLIILRRIANCLHPLAMCMDYSSTDWHTLYRGEQSTPSMFAFMQFALSAWSWAAVIIASMFFFTYPDITLPQNTVCKICNWIKGTSHVRFVPSS